MKNLLRAILLVCLILPAAAAVAAQSGTVMLTPQKMALVRPRPSMPHKKRYQVTYPRISGVSPEIAARIGAELDFGRVLDIDIASQKTDDEWLDEAGYRVLMNGNGLLQVELSASGSAAYPQEFSKTVLIETATGMRLRAGSVFLNHESLIARLNGLLKKEISATIEELRKSADGAGEFESLVEGAECSMSTLDDFSIDVTGITFHFSYGFPHAVQALEPAGLFKLTWMEMKPYIKPSGALFDFAERHQ